MPKLAAGRDKQLTTSEIALAMLQMSDAGPRIPAIRGLAAELGTSPMAIYHHFDSLADICQAAVDLVWREATTATLEMLSKSPGADPQQVLVIVGLATRRTWLNHFRLAAHMSATPQSNAFTEASLALMRDLFGQLGLDEEATAAAFHAYASFMIGAVLFAASRRAANEALVTAGSAAGRRYHPQSRRTRGGRRAPLSIDSVMDLSEVDPRRDEELFEEGLRRLVAGLVAA